MDQAGRIVAAVREVLCDDVLGAYLHGSSVIGGLRPSSDIDVIAVSRRPMTAPEKRALISLLLPMSGPGDPTGASRPANLEVVVQSDVRPWRYPPPLDFQFGDWWRPEFARGEFPWETPNPDLAVLLAMVLQAGRPLYGPAAAELLDPVPPADLRRAMTDCIPALLGYLDGDERNVVLTFARIWTSLATGRIVSKDAAADWAMPRLPAGDRAVMARARAIYLGEEPEEWDGLMARVRPCVDAMVAEIERLRDAGAGA